MKQKNILIITHRPRNNYGGIAQAYALQKVLSDLGHTVETTASQGSPYKKYVISNPLVKKYLVFNPFIRKILGRGPSQNDASISRLTRQFVKENIIEVPLKAAKKRSNAGLYDLYISGSDQVWRARYSYLPDYLLAFVKSSDTPKISYAASFGKDNLDEFSALLKKRTNRLAQRLDAISVREASGINLVKKYWGRDAYHHVDPTLLLSPEDYQLLIEKSASQLDDSVKGKIFTYILDPSAESESVVSLARQALQLDTFNLIDSDLNQGSTLPPFEQWLNCFKEANFVITDSFHGTVFSIIFNKPFIAIGNEKRGLARFSSLLETFSLTNRLAIKESDISKEIFDETLNWGDVNEALRLQRNKSESYLKHYL